MRSLETTRSRKPLDQNVQYDPRNHERFHFKNVPSRIHIVYNGKTVSERREFAKLFDLCPQMKQNFCKEHLNVFCEKSRIDQQGPKLILHQCNRSICQRVCSGVGLSTFITFHTCLAKADDKLN